MFEYGNLRFIEEAGWKFISGTEDAEHLETKGFIETLNFLGKQRWELIELEPEVGYMFKRSVKV